MIQIVTSGSSSWNHFKLFDSLVKVTLPYDQSLVTNEKAVRFYHYDDVNHTLESAGYDGQSTANNTITFEASTFSKFVAIEVVMSYFENLNSSLSVDTGFRPATDGWYIPNYGSYLENGGVCLGMTSYAKWYYRPGEGGSTAPDCTPSTSRAMPTNGGTMPPRSSWPPGPRPDFPAYGHR